MTFGLLDAGLELLWPMELRLRALALEVMALEILEMIALGLVAVGQETFELVTWAFDTRASVTIALEDKSA